MGMGGHKIIFPGGVDKAPPAAGKGSRRIRPKELRPFCGLNDHSLKKGVKEGDSAGTPLRSSGLGVGMKSGKVRRFD